MWAGLPVSKETDLVQLKQQVEAFPEAWIAAAKFLTENDLAALALGRHDLGVEGLFANVQEYTTRKASRYEAHRKYIDIQIVVSGHEYIYVAPLEKMLDPQGDYNEASDIAFFGAAADGKPVPAVPQQWLVLFPSDGHMPCMSDGTLSEVRKIVVKVPFIEK